MSERPPEIKTGPRFFQTAALRFAPICGKSAPHFYAMSKDTTKPKSKGKVTNEFQLLELLKRVLPKATHDSQLAGKIYEAVEAELKAKSRVTAFEKFCERVELPDLETKTLEDIKLQLAAAFGAGGDVVIQPDKKDKSLAVEITLPDGTQFQNLIKVRPVGAAESDEQEVKLKFIAFPVALPGDPELVWTLGKRENMSAEEAAIALGKAEEDFWASKTGVKLLRDRVERSFPEFIARAPAGLLTELGVKRIYALPEPIKILRVMKPQPKKSVVAA